MKSTLPSLFIVGFLTFGVGQNASAHGTYNFIRFPESLSPDTVDATSILAVLELSGSSPYDHTNVSSITFTPQAVEVLGYVGLYLGDLDETIGLNRVIENSNHVLGATSNDPGNIGVQLIDNDPPVPVDPIEDPLEIRISDPSRLGLSFFNEQEPFSYIINGTEHLSVAGLWVRVIPEPSSLTLGVCVVLMCAARRVRN